MERKNLNDDVIVREGRPSNVSPYCVEDYLITKKIMEKLYSRDKKKTRFSHTQMLKLMNCNDVSGIVYDKVAYELFRRMNKVGKNILKELRIKRNTFEIPLTTSLDIHMNKPKGRPRVYTDEERRKRKNDYMLHKPWFCEICNTNTKDCETNQTNPKTS